MTLRGVEDIQQGHPHTLSAPSRDDQGTPTIPPTLDANQQDGLQPVDTTATNPPPPARHSQPKLTPGMGADPNQQQHHQRPVIKPTTVLPQHLDIVAQPSNHPLIMLPTQAILDDMFFNIPATQAIDPIFDPVENITTATCVDDGMKNIADTDGDGLTFQQQQQRRMETALAPIPEDASLLQSKKTNDNDDDHHQHETGTGMTMTTTKENPAAAPAVVEEASHNSMAKQLATTTAGKKDRITAARLKKEREILLAAREADKLFCLNQKAATPMTNERPSQLSPVPSGWLFSEPATSGTPTGASTLGDDDYNDIDEEEQDVNNSLNICPTLDGDDAVALAELRKFYINMRDGTGPEQGAMGMLMISHSDVPKSVVFEVLTGLEDADSSMPEAYKRWWARIIWREVRKIGLGPFTFKDDTDNNDKGKGKGKGKGKEEEKEEDEAGNGDDIEAVAIDVDSYLAGTNEVAEREKDLSRLGFLLCSPAMDPAAAAQQMHQQQQQQQSKPAASRQVTVAPHLEDNAHALDINALISQRINPPFELLPLQQQQQQQQRQGEPGCDGVSQLSLGLMSSMPPPVRKPPNEPAQAEVEAEAEEAPDPGAQAAIEEKGNIETGYSVPPTLKNSKDNNYNQPGDDDPQQSYPLEMLMSADRRAMENTPTVLTTAIPSGNQPLSLLLLLQSGQDEEVHRGARGDNDRGVVIPETQHPEEENGNGDDEEERNTSRPLPTMCSAPNHHHYHPLEQLSTLPSLLEETEPGRDDEERVGSMSLHHDVQHDQLREEEEEEREEEDLRQLQPSINPANDLYSIDNDDSQKQASQGHAARKRSNAMKMIEDIANTFPVSQDDPPAAAMARPIFRSNLLFKKKNTAINNKTTMGNALKQGQAGGSGRSRLNNVGDVAMVEKEVAAKAEQERAGDGANDGDVDGSLDLVAVISDALPVAAAAAAAAAAEQEDQDEHKEEEQQYSYKEAEAKEAQAKAEGKMPAEEKSSKLKENLLKMRKPLMKKRGSDVRPDLALKRIGRVTRQMAQNSQRITRSQYINNKQLSGSGKAAGGGGGSGGGGGGATRGSKGMKKRSNPTVARPKALHDVQRRDVGCGLYQKRPPYKDEAGTGTGTTGTSNGKVGGSKSNVQPRASARRLSAAAEEEEEQKQKDQDAKDKQATTRPDPEPKQPVAEEEENTPKKSSAEDTTTISPAEEGRSSRKSKDIALQNRKWMVVGKGAAAKEYAEVIQRNSEALFGGILCAADTKSPMKQPNNRNKNKRATATSGLHMNNDYIFSDDAEGAFIYNLKQNKHRRNKQPTTAMVDNPQEGKGPVHVAVVAKVGQKRRMSSAAQAPPEGEVEMNEEEEQPPASPQQDKRMKAYTKVIDSPDLHILNQKGRHQIIATQQATQATQNTEDRTIIEHIEKKDGARAAEAAKKAAAAATVSAKARQRRSLPANVGTDVGLLAQIKTTSDIGLRSGKRRMSAPAAVTAAATKKKKEEERALSSVAEDNHQQEQEHGGQQHEVGAAARTRKRKATTALPPLPLPPSIAPPVHPPPQQQQQSGSATTTLNRSTTPITRNQHKLFSGTAFLLTSIDDKSAQDKKTAYCKMITDMGGTVLEDIPKFGSRSINRFSRFFIIAGEVRKTLKVLYAHALGIDILSPSWLERCHSKNKWCVPRSKSSNSDGGNTTKGRRKSLSAGTSDFVFEKPHGKKPFEGVAVHLYPRKADIENVLKFAGAVIVDAVELSDVFFFLKEENYNKNEARRIGKNGKKAGSVELVQGKEGIRKALEIGDLPPEVVAALTKKKKGDGDKREEAQQQHEGGTLAAADPQQLINNDDNNDQHIRQHITTSGSGFGQQSISSTYSSPKALPSQQHQSAPENGAAGVECQNHQYITAGGIQWLGASKARFPEGNEIIRTCYEGFLLPPPSAAANKKTNRALQPQPVRIGDFFEVSVLGNFKQIKQVVKLWTDKIGGQDLPHMVTRKIYRAWDVGLKMFKEDVLLVCEETETNVGMGDIGNIVKVLDREDTAGRISFYYDHEKNVITGRRYTSGN